jgi:hypothetical protein
MLNVFMGFEQANRYAIMNPRGEHVGYLAEEDQGFVGTLTRQMLRTHRPFKYESLICCSSYLLLNPSWIYTDLLSWIEMDVQFFG